VFFSPHRERVVVVVVVQGASGAESDFLCDGVVLFSFG
jgi:hypothetical protein